MFDGRDRFSIVHRKNLYHSFYQINCNEEGFKIKIINSIKESIKLKIIGNQTKTPKI